MRKFFLLLMLVYMSLAMSANDKLSAPTLSFLQERSIGINQNVEGKRLFAKSKAVDGVETIDCFISLNSMSKADLEAKGVIITGEFDGIVSALIPVDRIEEVASLKCVNQIAIAREVHHQSDKAKNITNAIKAWSGTSYGLPQAFTGQNVVVGVIDGGIEFNHIAFKDASGNTRVKAVYLPNATSGGSAASVNGVSFSGRQYTGSEIASINTDDTQESHGTHTSGCAGASTIGGYSGMAPDCDLVLCGLGPTMYDTSIANSVKYIANYAKSVGKPCVISISLGSNMGPHDGKSSICRVFDQVANQFGAVILLAAGNEADATGYATKTLSSSTDVMTILHEGISGYGGSTATLQNYAAIDIWNSTNSQMTVKVLVVNKNTGAVAYTSDAMTSGTLTSTQLSAYFTNANIQISTSISNGRRNIYINPTVSGAKNSSYRIAYVISGNSGDKIEAWTDGGYYSVIASSGNVSGYNVTYGTADGTMTDDICGLKTISVGAMCSRLSTPKNSFSNSPYSVNDVAYFSSYGTDFNGNNHPYITAPGHAVIAPINKYDTYNYSSYYINYCEYNTTINGQKDYWDSMSGTSMATPIAAGVVALYLQANPELDVDGVKAAIAASSTAYINPQSPAKQRGHGIINALDGISYILEQSMAPRIEVSQTDITMTGYIGDTITSTVQLQGYNLTQGVSINVVGPSIYSVEPTSFTNAEIMAGATLTIKYIPTVAGSTSATINLNSAGAQQVSLSVNGTAQPKISTITVNPESLNITAYAGGTATSTFRVYGQFIDNNVTLTSDNEFFTLSPTTIAASELANGSYATVTVTYSPTEAGQHQGVITLKSTGVEDKTIVINGVATIRISAPVAIEATDIGSTSFVANWEPCLFATSYSLRFKPLLAPNSLLVEAFGKCEKVSTANIANDLDSYCDNVGWTGTYLYQSLGGLRLGSTSNNGTLISPALDLSGTNGKIRVKFNATTYGSDDDCPLEVRCGNNAGTQIISSSDSGSYIITLDCLAESGQSIQFATTTKKKRVIITRVEILKGDVADENDSNEYTIINGITDTHYLVNGLLSETIYIYNVNALYGTEQSTWSNQVLVTTLAGGGHVYGDVNGDGQVTSVDITCIYNYLLNGDTTFLATCDVDGDGSVSSVDITCIYNILLGN